MFKDITRSISKMQRINMAITQLYSLMTCVLTPSQVFTTLFKPREISRLVMNSILFVYQPTSAETQQAAVVTANMYFRIVFSLELARKNHAKV